VDASHQDAPWSRAKPVLAAGGSPPLASRYWSVSMRPTMGKALVNMAEPGRSSSAIVAPLILLDDDQYLAVYESVAAFTSHWEFPYVDEIVALFDANAMALRATTVDEEIFVELGGGASDLGRLYAVVDEFFHLWTDEPPPEHLPTAAAYAQLVAERYATARVRRRKRRPRPA
jgi:hypothetical protein